MSIAALVAAVLAGCAGTGGGVAVSRTTHADGTVTEVPVADPEDAAFLKLCEKVLEGGGP